MGVYLDPFESIPSPPDFWDRVDIAHAEAKDTPVAAVCDDCSHTETEHADPDYDYDYEAGRYVADPRPCLMEGCDCGSFSQ